MAGHPEQSQDGANHDDNNADRPDVGDLLNEPVMSKITPRMITFSS
jgi:hypothetical protein